MSRQDRLDQLVSQGFDLLREGDIDGAEAALARAQRIDRRHADVIDLEAGVASVIGEEDRSVELYHRVAELRPDDPAPWINAAVVELHHRADAEASLAAIARAMELVEDDESFTDAMIVKADALLALDRVDEARATLAELDSSHISDNLTLQVAELYLDVLEPAKALALAQRATEVEPLAADAYHLIGQLHDKRGDAAARTAAWLETRKLDLAAEPTEWSLSHEEFDRVAQEAIRELPERAQELLANTPVLVEDLPSEELVKDGVDPRLLGLFSGRPYPEHATVGGTPALTTIHLFQRNLEDTSEDPDDLFEQIRITVLHETAHFFGLDEDELETIGLD